MYIYLLEVEFRINDAYSLKEKRKIIKSIIDYSRNTLKISSAELDYNEKVNYTSLGFVTISNDNDKAREILERLLDRIYTSYPVEITKHNIERI